MCNIGSRKLFFPQRTIPERKRQIGWRFFHVHLISYDYISHSYAQNNVPSLSPIFAIWGRSPWLEPVAVADCPPGLDKFDVDKGLHFFYSEAEALKQLGLPIEGVEIALVLAKCEYWGKVVRHQVGIRTEFGRVLEVFVDTPKFQERLQASLQPSVPVKVFPRQKN